MMIGVAGVIWYYSVMIRRVDFGMKETRAGEGREDEESKSSS